MGFWGPYNKDYRILGSVLGSAYLAKLPYSLVADGFLRTYSGQSYPRTLGKAGLGSYSTKKLHISH